MDVCVDGGDNWLTAAVEGPVLSKAVTMFGIPWEWREGRRAHLQSRAMNETGRVQPNIAELQGAQGGQSIYHKNNIRTWLVEPDEGVVNAQIDA